MDNTQTQDIIERNTIGIALQSQRDFHDLAGIRSHHFRDPVNAQIWAIMQRLDSEGVTFDPMVVVEHRDYADPATRPRITAAYVAECVTQAPYGHLGPQYAGMLKENHDKHGLAQMLARADQLLTGGASAQNVRLEIMEGVARVESSAKLVSADEAFSETRRGFDEITPYVPTPWSQLNWIIRGWRPGGLYIVGARPAVGKSLMLQKAALHLADKGPVLMATMEMRPAEVMQRMVAVESGVELDSLVGRDDQGRSPLSPQDWQRIDEAGQRLKQLPLAFAERVQTPADVRSYARDISVRQPLAGIMVDYLQLMSSRRRVENRTQEVTQFTRELKLMAMEFNCPVIVASQLNRNAANEKRPPNISELRESGSIEQDADAVILLHSDPEIIADPNGKGIALDAIVAKNRQGSPGLALMRRFGKTADIQDDKSGRKEKIK